MTKSLRQAVWFALANRLLAARSLGAEVGVVAQAWWLDPCPVCAGDCAGGPFALEAGLEDRVALVLVCYRCRRRWRLADALRTSAGAYEYAPELGE